MVRAPSHVKETIACRAFERALHPNLVPHATRQGADYGIDYLVNVFGDDGELERTFAAQIKYVDPDAVLRPDGPPAFSEWQIFSHGFTGPSVARIPFPKRKLAEYLDRARTPAEVVVVAANDAQFLCVWLSDLYDYWLRWIPNVLDGSGTLTLLLNSVRGAWTRSSAESDPRVLLLREINSDRGGWFDADFRPGSVASIANVAITAFLQTADRRSMRGRPVDVAGMWSFLIGTGKRAPIVPLLFGKQLALLTPTEEMSRSALSVIREWNDIFSIPLGFYVLAGTENPKDADTALDLLENVDPLALYWRPWIDAQFAAGYDRQDHHLDLDFFASIATFLASVVARHRSERAQAILVRAFAHFSYGRIPNFYAWRLAALARERRLVPGRSRTELEKFCRVGTDVSPAAFERAIEETDDRWDDEAREER